MVMERVGRQPKRFRKGAIVAMELLLVLPLMMAIFFGTVEFGLLMAAEARLYNASREGARVAAAGGNLQEVQTAAKNALLPTEAPYVTIDAVLYSDPPTNSLPVLPGGTVAVMASAPARALVPDFLRFIGVSIAHRCLSAQTVMRKE